VFEAAVHGGHVDPVGFGVQPKIGKYLVVGVQAGDPGAKPHGAVYAGQPPSAPDFKDIEPSNQPLLLDIIDQQPTGFPGAVSVNGGGVFSFQPPYGRVGGFQCGQAVMVNDLFVSVSGNGMELEPGFTRTGGRKPPAAGERRARKG
jgi:hypothetical protein